MRSFGYYRANPLHLLGAIIQRISFLFPEKLYLEILFYFETGYKLNLKDPKTFNEKLQWLKLYNRNSIYTQMVDKYEVKNYVSKIIGDEFIIPTLGVWDNADDIDIDTLPNQFVLKTTHSGGGGGIAICKDKSNFDFATVSRLLNQNLKKSISAKLKEWPYEGVKRRIIAEKYIVDDSASGSSELKDYKFFCFNGRVEVLKIDFSRFVDHHANYYDRDMNLLDFGEICCPPDFKHHIEKPKNFEKMINIAEQLSKGLPFARIDLYNSDGQIFFGEITFFPASGLGNFTSFEWDLKLGNLIDLKTISKK